MGFHYEPKRVHPEPKRSERQAYHRRIQKKWTKRFGLHCVETLKRGETIFDRENNVVYCRREDEDVVRVKLCSD